MRHRVEDLGRIAVLIRLLFDETIFSREHLPCRTKDYYEWFHLLDEERKKEALHAWVYGIVDIMEGLYNILDIAEGADILNQPSEERF